MNEVVKFTRSYFPFLLLTPALLPFLISGGLMYPYLVPKTLAFYAVALLAIGVFALLAFSGEAFHFARLKTRFAWVPGMLLVLAYVASAFGVDFYRSFWSLYVRGDGLLMLTCAIASFYLILLTADATFSRKLWKVVAWVGSLVALYGVGEWCFEGGRIGGLLGNAAFFAGYLGISLFITLAIAPSLSKNWKNTAYIGAAFQVLAVVLSATRGTLLALVVSAVVFLLYTALRSHIPKARHWSWGALAVLVLVAGSFVVFRSELATVSFAPVARVASASAADPDIASRLFIWKNMLGQIGQHPLLGVGAEHIDTLFNHFYDPTQIEEEWFDRSHNAYLDYTAQYGVGGLVLYLLLITSLLYGAWQYRKKDSWAGEMFFLGALTYAVQNFFIFDTVSSFWLLLALAATLLALSKESTVPTALSFRSSALGILVALVSLVLIIPASVLPLAANHDLFEAYLYHVANVSLTDQYLSKGFALHTYADVEYGYEVYAMYTGEQARMLSGSDRVAAFTTTKNILTANYNRYPYDARTALYLASVISVSPPEVQPDLSLERDAIQRSLALSPKRAEAWFLLTNLSISDANENPPGSALRTAGYTKAASTLIGYTLLVPALSEPHFVLAELYLGEGDRVDAATEAAKGKALYTPDLQTATRAAGYYEGVSDWNDATFFLGEVVRLNPNDYTSLYDLAKTTYLSGDKAGAEHIVQILRAKDQSILSTDAAFLSAIQTYEQSGH